MRRKDEFVGHAEDIVVVLCDRGFSGADGITLISMPLGISLNAQEGAPRQTRKTGQRMTWPCAACGNRSGNYTHRRNCAACGADKPNG